MRLFISFLEKSHLFVAGCAALLVVQTFLIAGIQFNSSSPLLAFFSTWFVYNLSVLKVKVVTGSQTKNISIRLHGDQLNILFAAVCIPVIVLLLPGCNMLQVVLFMLTAVLSLFYMMPLTFNKKKAPGLRSHWIIKDVLLSVIWSLATVLIPLAGDGGMTGSTETVYLFARNFLFIYALTVIYDLRDVRSDQIHGIKTLVMRLGINGARIVAAISLTLFVLLTWLDPLAGLWVKQALAISAFIAMLLIWNAGPEKSVSYYTFGIDGAMLIQSLLVILFYIQG